MIPSLNNTERALLKKVLTKYPNLMITRPHWESKITENSFRSLSHLLTMMTDTTQAALDNTTREKMEMLIKLLEVYKFDNTIISDMKDAISKAWEHNSEASILHKRS